MTLNEWVAENVMGWVYGIGLDEFEIDGKPMTFDWGAGWWPKCDGEYFQICADKWNPPNFDQRIQDAWLVVEKMTKSGHYFKLETNENGGWWALFLRSFRNKRPAHNYSDTAPRAICLAAYKAVTGKDWKDE